MYRLVKLFDKEGVIPAGEKIISLWKNDGVITEVETDKAVYTLEKV